MTPTWRSAVATLILALSPALASAQDADPFDQYSGRAVSLVRFEVEGRPDPSTALVQAVDVKAGAPLRREDVRASIAKLDQTGRFEDISVQVRDAASGVDVVFNMTPRHQIDRISFVFTTPTALVATTLESEFRRQFGGVPSNARIAAAEDDARRMLNDLGYLDAVVITSTLATHQPERATLVFTVTPGELARIGEVRVTGRSSFSPEAVVARARAQHGQPYRRRDIQAAMSAIQEELRAQGYYEASAIGTAVRNENGAMDVAFVVEAGRRVVLKFEGDPLPKSIGSRDDLVPMKREGSADDDLLESSRRTIESRLKNQGHKDAQVAFTSTPLADGSLAVTFRVISGPRYRIDHVEIPDGLVLGKGQIAQALDLSPGVPFSANRVNVGLTRVLVQYQQRGYIEVAAEPKYEDVVGATKQGSAWLVVHPGIVEGRRHVVGAVTFSFPGGPQQITDAELRGVMRSKEGEPYVPAYVRRDLFDLETYYQNRGFRPTVVITPTSSPRGADVGVALNVAITEGPQLRIGTLNVVGNRGVSERAIRDELTLREGEPLGEAARLESQRKLYDLGVFRRVTIEAEPTLSGETQATVVVSVEELPSTTLGYGGGLEVGSRTTTNDANETTESLELRPRGFFEIGRRNLGGRNRSINLFSRVGLDRRNPDTHSAREYRVTGTLREAHAFHSETDLLVGLTAEQTVRTSFSFVRQLANAEALRRISPRLSVSGRYALDFTELFDEAIPPNEQFSIDRLFPQVRLSTFSAGVQWDRRDNVVAPARGTFLTGDIEVAGRAVGSEVGYAKSFWQLSGFKPLQSGSRRHILAGRVELGLARGFERREVPRLDENGQPIIGPDGIPETILAADLPASQRFFAGGGTTVRGFQLDRLGVREVLNNDGLSNGGNALLVINAEMRSIVGKLFGRNVAAVGFVDSGNVFRRARDLDLSRLRTTLGLGVRYDSPIGPLRLDLGYKTTRLVFNNKRERGWEYHFSIGEAF